MPSLAILMASILFTLPGRLLAAPFSPGPVIRNTSLCSGQNLTGNIPYTNDFTFTLFSVSKTNNSVHTALGLKSVIVPTFQGPEVYYALTADSVAQNFSIFDGGITALNSSGAAVAVSRSVGNQNSMPTFAFTEVGETLTPAEAFCIDVSPEVVNSKVPEVEKSYIYTLAANNHSELFSLCTKSSSEVESIVVYNASSTAPGYDWTTCTAVKIFLLPG